MALMHVDFFSETLHMCSQMDVILPQKTRAQIGMEGNSDAGQWKVLYLLHGLSDDHTIWQRRTSIERYVSDKPLAVVMPTTQRGWYTDMQYGFAWQTFIMDELPRICKRFFPNISTRREDTFVAGLSMGGYGALKLALTKPEQYSFAASLSGALDIAEICQRQLYADRSNYFTDIFGDADKVRGSKHDLFALAKNVKASGKPCPEIYLWCGRQDGLYPQSTRMRDTLKDLDWTYTYEESDGVHEWKYWDEKIQTVLSLLPLGKE